MEIVEIYLGAIDSTHTYAKTHGESFEAGKITCITAEVQTAGKGQFQRKWVSPAGVNLYTTFYFHLPTQVENITTLALLMATSVKTVLEKEGLHLALKWPNDVLLNGKKVAGALCETVFHPHHIEIILSFGLNVNMEEKDLATIDRPATSLKNETHRLWDKKDLLKKIQQQFLFDLTAFKKTNHCE